MINCPDKNNKSWKDLVENVGELNAYGLWAVYQENVPSEILKKSKAENTLKEKIKTIPVKKLQELLIKEVNSREGYPANMLSMLELTPDGKDFKFPIWASPFSVKFESILMSLINNKIIKQKFPGHSYVLGSEEGFRIKKGKSAKFEITKPGVVVSKNYDPKKGLQPMRIDEATGKVLPAQIMIPFKFRDEQGNILDVKDFITDGFLDFEKIPQKVLNLFGFRIPTQERNSMAAIEIVGFLPQASGDLMLAPRDWTRQMGSDFDVDKLYTYMYNTHYKDGKLHTDFSSNKKEIAKDLVEVENKIEELKEELKITKEEELLLEKVEKREDEENMNVDFNSLFTMLGSKNSEEVTSELKSLYNERSKLKRSYRASQQNAILEIHQKVMTSTNEEVLSSLIELDSFGKFKEFADKAVKKPTLTPLSDSYQREKYINATAGKDGVGSFSLDSTFNAKVQGKDIAIINIPDSSGVNVSELSYEQVLALNFPLATFGKTVSYGDLSNKYTLRSQEIIQTAKNEERELTKEEKKELRMKSSIIRALQSSAVDNEKEQILDKLNINSETFDTIRALTQLGFEEEDIVGLLTQPIIWEYVNNVKTAKSSIGEYVSDSSEKVKSDLYLKYDFNNEISKRSTPSEKSGVELMTISDTVELVETREGVVTPDSNIEQLMLLEKFLTLADYGKTIKTLQSTINTESSGLSKSIIENNIKSKQIENLVDRNDVLNVDKLLYDENGLTIAGMAVKHGVKLAQESFNNLFPYDNKDVLRVFSEIESHLGNPPQSVSQEGKKQADIFKEMMAYLYSHPQTNLYTDNSAFNERKRLFIDSPSNTSLSMILRGLSEKSWYKRNQFLNKLTFPSSLNGELSRVFFDAGKGENFDESEIYKGFSRLLIKNIPIGTFNGIEYTTRMLGQELILAAFLDGGQFGAKQYLKYIPTSYLKGQGMGDFMKIAMSSNIFNLGSETLYTNPSLFTTQYFQNNPGEAVQLRTIDIIEKQKGNDSSPLSFTLTDDAFKNNLRQEKNIEGLLENTLSQFVALDNPLSPKKKSLYQYDNVNKEYRRISTLGGDNGFSEYSSIFGAKSIIENNNSLKDLKTVPQVAPPSVTLPLETNEDKTVDTDFEYIKINDSLRGTQMVDDLFNQIELSEEIDDYSRELMTQFRNLEFNSGLVIKFGVTSGVGSYNSDSNILTLNKEEINKEGASKLTTTLLHELSHANSSRLIKDYLKDPSTLTKQQREAVEDLQKTQEKYIDYLSKQGSTEEVLRFKEKYKRFKNGEKVEFTERERSTYYGTIKLEEFLTMALTDKGFQQILNEIKDVDGVPFWTKFVESLLKVLSSIGIDVKQGSLLATALENSWKIVSLEQVTEKSEPVSGIIKNPKSNILELRRDKIEYTSDQIQALSEVEKFVANDEQFFLLAGYAGTGKTTIAENIANYTNAMIIAPTNTAVKRLKEKLNDDSKSFSTIHSFLYGEPDENGVWVPGKLENVKNGYVIIDESSMIEETVLNELVSALKEVNAKAIFIGDGFQLEPVGKDPKLFSDFPFDRSTLLSEVKRSEGDILKVATHIRSLKKPELLNIESEEFKIVSNFENELNSSIKNNENFTVLVSTNAARLSYNSKIRKEKFGKNSEKIINEKELLVAVSNNEHVNSEQFEVENIQNVSSPIKFTLKDYNGKVKNHVAYEVSYLTEKGASKTLLLIPGLDQPSLYGQELVKVPEFAHHVIYTNNGKPKWNGTDITTYGYSLTVHKSQGNEWDNVFIDINYMAPTWNAGRFVYTAITRGKNKVRVKNSNAFKIVPESVFIENKNSILSENEEVFNERNSINEEENLKSLERESNWVNDPKNPNNLDNFRDYLINC